MRYSILALAFLLALNFQSSAQNCKEAIEVAQKSYDLGQFQEVIDALDQCLPSIKNQKELIEAHKLLAYAYLAFDATHKVEEEVSSILNLQPDYDSDLDAPVFFTRVVGKVKQKMADGVTSSVSKKQEKIELVPASIEVITEEEILRRGYRSLEELFHDISGFDITSTKGEQYSLLYQRGYRSDLGDRTLVLINGIEDNGLYTNEAHITRQYPISNIERVEVIYGPATTMYGANAFQGVINVVTKDARQLVNQGSSFGGSAHVGYGTWNTRVLDATLAGRKKKVGFSVTGRLFESDEMDLSEYGDFNYNLDEGFDDEDYRSSLGFSASGNSQLLSTLQRLDSSGRLHVVDGDRVLPTQLAIRGARDLDSIAMADAFLSQGSERRDIDLQYANPTKNYYVETKLNFDKLNLGFQLWQKEEGQGGLVTDRFFASGDENGADLTSWQIRQFTFYTQYSTKISDKVAISNFGTFKNFAHFPSLRQTTFKGYVNGGYGLVELLKDSTSSWSQTFSFLRSKQFKNELKAVFFLSPKLDVVSGFEVRFGAIPQKLLDITTAEEKAFAHIDAVTKKRIPGGNIVHSNEFGLYAQGSYLISNNLRATFGARADYNIARERDLEFSRNASGFGYGLKINPRLALVYNPNRFVFKAIYASAFLNPSNFQRFGTSAGRIPNPTLETERVRNIDIAGRWKVNEASYVELIAYRAFYSNVIQSGLTDDGELQFQNKGAIEIYGLQVNAKYAVNNWGCYGNYSFTEPLSKKGLLGQSAEKRVGDIASHSFNVGSYVHLFNGLLTADLRANAVGKRKTGKKTTVEENRFDSIGAYQVFDGSITLNGIALSNSLKGLRFQFTVNNLFNQEYFHPGARAADGLILTSRIPQETRHFFLKLQYQL